MGPASRQTGCCHPLGRTEARLPHLWEYLRANWLSHRLRDGYEAIVACCEAWNRLMQLPDRITSITTRAWARVNV